MSPVTPRKLKSCLSSTSSPSDCSSPANSLASTPTATATPPTPYYPTGGSSCYSTPTPAPRRQKKSVRFHPEAEIKEFRQVREIRETRSRSSGSTSTVTKRTEETQVVERKVEKTVVEKKVVEKKVEKKAEKKVERRVVEKKEEVLEVKKGKKRKESQDESYYYESTNGIMQGGGTGLGITVDHSYGPPTKAPPQAPLPRPAKRERTKYSQSPQTKPVEPKMTYSFDDSTSTSSYPNMSFGQAPPPPVPTLNSSFTEIGNYPPVPQIMSTGFAFTEQAEQKWWAYQEPSQQPPTAAASSRPLRRKRSFEAKKIESRQAQVAAPEIVDVDSMRSRRGSSKSTSSASSSNPMDYTYNEPKVEIPTRTSSRRRREEENWEEQYRMESLKRQARQKTRDREIKKHSKHSRADPNSSFDHDAGAGYYNKGPAYSFSAADEGYDRYF
ncbi:hypothetical protein TWF694_000492 [Orbilia ellipsospora]|uniref:Uncharacterized protein n=1 Tax=Orbilia ellipsospora TaxID=2528407 RepID=A0AAV9XNQ7_9PEZI